MTTSFRAFARPLSRRAALALGLALTLVPPLAAHEFKAGAITIGHPWSRATPQGAKVAAGYLKLTNTGTEPDRLLSATAEIAGKTEIHQMSVDAKGVMTMRALTDGVELAPGATVALEPGSYHLMFQDLKSSPIEGTPFKGTLTFEKAGTVDVTYVVQPIGGTAKDGGMGDMTGHDMSTMKSGG